MHRRLATRTVTVLATATALIAGLFAGPVGGPAAAAATPTVTLVGSLQSELGCPGDWQLDCAATDLQAVAGGIAYTATFAVPAGTWEFKVAVDRGWERSYGPDGGTANGVLTLAGAARVRVTYDDLTHRTTLAPADLGGGATPADAALARDSLRTPLTRERFYFLMADRFANGDPANDTGGLTGAPAVTGFDPTHKGFFHGGDLAGVTARLDYIKGLGTTAIWLTPSFKNRPVQGTGADATAGYHGYWVTDFTQIDPHLGTNAEMKALVDAAHARGMKVFFDIITNHTADLIGYQGGTYTYVPKSAVPYKDAAGNVFDDAAVAQTPAFPPLDLQSFPYVPVLHDPADATTKVPAWLNDLTMYHNRGDSTFAGESSTYGDFAGLDDLFTERPEVSDGMAQIYRAWVDLGIDGFRVDTVKHVNMQFWQAFVPAIQAHAAAVGRPDFFTFGEVFDGDPRFLSQYTTTGRLPATLDFGFQGTALAFASSKETSRVRDLFAADDYYTDADSNAYSSPTFLGNHDMGRLAMMLSGAGYSGTALADRVKLANSLMYLTRGQPVTYYGDEQGFIGSGGDKDARQDMFATQVAQYAAEPLVGGGTLGSRDRYDTDTALYRHIAGLAAVRAAHPALADGAQIHRYASGAAGIYAVSRVDRSSKVEYLVVANNDTTERTATLATYTSDRRFDPVYGGGERVRSGRNGRVSVTVPPLSVRVLRASGPIDQPRTAPAVVVTSPTVGAVVGGRAEIGAALAADVFAQVTFAVRPVGTSEWQVLGTDDNVPYRVFHDVTAIPKGTLLEYRVVAKVASGAIAAASTSGIVGDPVAPPTGGGGGGPVVQPTHVSVPGSHNSEMGCADDWQPACDQAQLTLDPASQIWSGTATVPAGDYEYKAAIDKAWDENYGAGGVRNGPNIAYSAPGGPVTFFYDHGTHYVTSDAQGPIVTAPGSYQSELGCSGDWLPDCMRPWLQDPDGDSVYTWSGAVPAGNYEFKIAHGRSWSENYGEGGAPNGANLGVSVPSDGTVVTISYDIRTHLATTRLSRAGSAPDLTKAKAVWVSRDLLAWPATAMPSGIDPRALRWRLYWSRQGGLGVDVEGLGAGPYARLTYDPAGLPAAVLAAHPQLRGYFALRLADGAADDAEQILVGQVAVSLHDTTGALLDATGVQIPLVLDDLYAARATSGSYGVSFARGRPTFRVWAPTAERVTLLTWPAGSSPTAPVDQATRTTMRRASDGSWSARLGPRAGEVRYLYEVTVYAPSTGKVETNRVTDPASVALTLNSTRSVAVDLAAAAYRPAIWADTPSPPLARAVDSTIYELHIRDFSMSDPAVPEQLRGSYLAFAAEGQGRAHLRGLARAGLNTVHLLPSFDIASIEEDPARQRTPECDLESYPPDGEQQQACVKAVSGQDAFNWGYDPWHWNVPEGSYASTAAAADGGARVAEFRTMVGALHQDGLRVVLDQVFNHTPTSGQAATSVLDRVVPGYYHRLDSGGAVYTSTCCQNVATEHAMAQKAMVDSVVSWARSYRVDGFRFDLMGHHSKANLLAIRAALDALTLERDGVDGRSIYLYGEGWNFGEVAGNALFEQASQGQLAGTGIGTFSDRLRDAVRGGGPFDEDPRVQGFGSGLAGDDNGSGAIPATDRARALAHATDLLQLGLAGNLAAYSFTSQEKGVRLRGDEIDYNGAKAGYAAQPDEVVTYVDAHDNETLFDSLTLKLPPSMPMAQRVRLNTLSLATVALAQTPAFWHAGADLLRSKSLDRNSYDSGDWFNRLDWAGTDNGFGRGLPPAADNQSKWPFMRPLLADPALAPSAADVQAATAAAQDLLRLRFSTPLFRLGSAEAITAKVFFPVSGTPQAVPGVVLMRIDDTVGADADPSLAGLVVVVNATPAAVAQAVPGLTGAALELSPVQAGGADPVVKASTWDAASATLTVPAHTVAVFVQR